MVRLRPAGMQDWARLFTWRNDEETRAQSRDSDLINLTDHMIWLRHTLHSPSVRLFVAEDPERYSASGALKSPMIAIGTGRLEERNHKETECSMTVDSRLRNHGYATQIVARLVEQARDSSSPPERLVAYVKPENVGSLRAFASSGFMPVTYGDLVRLELAL